jgi:NAD(P)-dependent dehydrogenase (short-subunit alcohol dehydrogenase family)
MDINVKGMIFGSRVAINGMLKQGFGQVYNMEGFGRDGRTMRGMTPYGSTKALVAYLTRSLAKECKGSCVSMSALSPGMVVTDLLMGDIDTSGPGFEKTKRIFNILADRVETVTPWMVERILKKPRNGGGIRWLTTPKIIYRFLSSPFFKRDIIR